MAARHSEALLGLASPAGLISHVVAGHGQAAVAALSPACDSAVSATELESVSEDFVGDFLGATAGEVTRPFHFDARV